MIGQVADVNLARFELGVVFPVGVRDRSQLQTFLPGYNSVVFPFTQSVFPHGLVPLPSPILFPL